MTKRWTVASADPAAKAAAKRWCVPPIVAQLLFNRGQPADQPATEFLVPQLKNLRPPSELPGAEKAAELIVDAVRAKSRIVLYGDYDVDGITGVSILWHLLTLAGADVAFYVPHRIEEGYGLNPQAAAKLIDDGAKLVITVDCGISAKTEADIFARECVKLIITDHHTLHGSLPRAAAIVHPALDGEIGPHVCGAGVAFKLAWAVAQQLSGSDRVDATFRTLLVELLPLVALGTIADVVPLVGENRILAFHGLAGVTRTALLGLRALIDSAGLGAAPIDDYDVGFKLAPRLNAAGRMGHARLAVELLTTANADRAREVALYLEDHNKSRRATERRILKQAIDRIEQHNLAGDARHAIVLASEEWHAGVIGIVAARLVDRYHRPVVLIAIGTETGQGSCRSIKHFNMTDALAACNEHLLSYGGHEMAAGLKIAPDQIEPFTEVLVTVANNRLTPADMVPGLYLDAEVSLDQLSLPTAEAITGLGPFGAGNPRPKFATGWVELAGEPRCVGKSKDHLQASFQQNGARLKAIGFGMADGLEDLKQHRRCRVAFAPIINDFNGRRTVEMQMLDLQFPE